MKTKSPNQTISSLKAKYKKNLKLNTSLNTSTVRLTLKTNNRNLAKALEMTRAELQMLKVQFIQLQQENQSSQQQLIHLQRIAGLKDAEIDDEVERRVWKYNESVRKVLIDASTSISSSADFISQAMTMCLASGQRRSGDRDSNPFTANRSLSPADCSTGAPSPETEEQPTHNDAVFDENISTGNQPLDPNKNKDMSIILEQSLADNSSLRQSLRSSLNRTSLQSGRSSSSRRSSQLFVRGELTSKDTDCTLTVRRSPRLKSSLESVNARISDYPISENMHTLQPENSNRPSFTAQALRSSKSPSTNVLSESKSSLPNDGDSQKRSLGPEHKEFFTSFIPITPQKHHPKIVHTPVVIENDTKHDNRPTELQHPHMDETLPYDEIPIKVSKIVFDPSKFDSESMPDDSLPQGSGQSVIKKSSKQTAVSVNKYKKLVKKSNNKTKPPHSEILSNRRETYCVGNAPSTNKSFNDKSSTVNSEKFVMDEDSGILFSPSVESNKTNSLVDSLKSISSAAVNSLKSKSGAEKKPKDLGYEDATILMSQEDIQRALKNNNFKDCDQHFSELPIKILERSFVANTEEKENMCLDKMTVVNSNDVTICESRDMELTAVIPSSLLLSQSDELIKKKANESSEIQTVNKTKESNLKDKVNKQKDSSADESSDNERVKSKITTCQSKPGEMKFIAEKRDGFMVPIARANSKSRSTLPKVRRSRSKPRAVSVPSKEVLSNPEIPQNVYDFMISPAQPPPAKSVYDLSLNESNIEVTAKNTKKTLKKPRGISKSPHGIMLVLGNGQRTRSKQRKKSLNKRVSYSQALTETHFRTPSPNRIQAVGLDISLPGSTPPAKLSKVISRFNQDETNDQAEDSDSPETKKTHSNREDSGPPKRSRRTSELKLDNQYTEELDKENSGESADNPKAVKAKSGSKVKNISKDIRKRSSQQVVEAAIHVHDEKKSMVLSNQLNEDSDKSTKNKEMSVLPNTDLTLNKVKHSKNEISKKSEMTETKESKKSDKKLNKNDKSSTNDKQNEKTNKKLKRSNHTDKKIDTEKQKTDKNISDLQDLPTKKGNGRKSDANLNNSFVKILKNIKHERLSVHQTQGSSENATSTEISQKADCESLNSKSRQSVSVRNSDHKPSITDNLECRRPRRGASTISYKEPTLGAKLRQGDLHTSSIYSNQGKTADSKLKRSSLQNITNKADVH